LPPIAIYRVNFNDGNLQPALDVNGWGPMRQSGHVPGVIESWPEPDGLHLSYTRRYLEATGENRVHIPLPAMALPLSIRLFTRVSFDFPMATTFRVPSGIAEFEAWAVALRVRFGSLGQDPGAVDARTHVTCQFHKTGVRLNTPMSLQRDGPSVLDSPLDYSEYRGSWFRRPTRFYLEHAFCGFTPQQNPHVTGSGSLSMLPGTQDHRVYSNKNSSGATTRFIKELSIVLTMTEASFGRISARLRTFTLYVQSTASGVGETTDEI
jgi:hypothetical protein